MASANRTFVQQAAAEHQHRFPDQKTKGNSGATPLADREGNVGRQRSKRVSGAGGNAFLTFANQKLHAKKQFVAPDRPLTNAELSLVRQQARDEWAALDPEDQHHWAMVQAGQALQRNGGREKASDSTRPSSMSVSRNLWGLSLGSQDLVPPEAVIQQYHGRSASERRLLAQTDASLVVADLDPRRSLVDKDQAESSRKTTRKPPHACWERKANVCKCILAPSISSRMSAIALSLKRWSNTLLAEDALGCNALLLLKGHPMEGTTDPSMNAIVLLVIRRKLPRTQIFARLLLDGGGGDFLRSELPEVPFGVQIATRRARTDVRHEAFDLVTSDELALELAKCNVNWVLHRLEWTEASGPSLRKMQVVAIQEAFGGSGERPRPQKKGRFAR